MFRLLVLVGLAFALLAPAVAQERFASVKLEDGRSFEGRVLVLNLDMMEIEVGTTIVKIPAAQIRSCRFWEGVAPVVTNPAAAGAPSAGGAAKVGNETEANGDVAKAVAAQQPAKRVTWTGPIPDPIVPGSAESVPVDQRSGSLWQRRISALDRAYSWMVPAAPSQWLSLGLLLLIAAGLIVHVSVSVAGGDDIRIGRSVGLGVCYIVSGLAQVAMVPINDLSVVLMLLLNTTLALFALCSLFGLVRFSAAVALCVQLGLGVLVFGILELVTALLGSVSVAP